MKNVLVTGATGFVGQHLVELLSKDSDLKLYGTYHSSGSDSKLSHLKDQIALFQADLTQKDEVEDLFSKINYDQVYHLAAQVSPSESFKDPIGTLSTNTNSQFYLLDTLSKQSNHPRIITVTSSEIYGKVDFSDLPVNEQVSYKPISPYSVSKIAQDYLSYYFFLVQKLDVIRARPFNHTGPGQEKFVVPSFARQIALIEKSKQEPVIKVGNLAAKKDFSDVRDIVKAYKLLMEKGMSGEAYNMGSGKSVEIRKILDILLSFSDLSIQTEIDQSLFRPIDVEDIYADCTKIKNDTGWSPEIPLKNTLKDVLDYFRKVV